MTDSHDTHSLPQAPGGAVAEATKPGNYFVANYPPFSFWSPDHVAQVHDQLERSPDPDTTLGLYVHIPFCRKRCHFCYFKVYTDKNSDEIRAYMDAVIEELARYAAQPYIRGRKPKFIYFGGGTPSYLSAEQLAYFFENLQKHLPWDDAEEIAFECEPGTLNEKKLEALHRLGVTRLSLGIEHFDDHVLEINGRAHRSKQVYAAYEAARRIGFDQINIDLIAGMLEETPEKWVQTVDEALRLEPDSVTIYQMEIPFNTTIYRRMKDEGKLVAPIADWKTKRQWVRYAFDQFEAAGYSVGSAYTAVKDKARTKFLYRDELWTGADLLSVGVASFGHLGGVHYQNQHEFSPYVSTASAGKLPIYRAYRMNEDEQLVREFILQLKLGTSNRDYFVKRFDVDPLERFAEPVGELIDAGLLRRASPGLVMDRDTLLKVDTLLDRFFLPEHRDARYT